MLRITQRPATAAVAAEHPVARAGRQLVRYTLAVVIAWIGALKFTTYEATAIQPLISHSPVFSWLYSIFSVRAFAAVLGTLEIIAAVLIAIRPLAPRISVIGSARGVLLFLSTLSFLFTNARSDRGRRFPGAVGAARPVPAQGPRAGKRLAMDAGRLAGRHLGRARRAWWRAAPVMAACGPPAARRCDRPFSQPSANPQQSLGDHAGPGCGHGRASCRGRRHLLPVWPKTGRTSHVNGPEPGRAALGRRGGRGRRATLAGTGRARGNRTASRTPARRASRLARKGGPVLTAEEMLNLAAELTDATAEGDAESLAAIAWQLYGQAGENHAEIVRLRAALHTAWNRPQEKPSPAPAAA